MSVDRLKVKNGTVENHLDSNEVIYKRKYNFNLMRFNFRYYSHGHRKFFIRI